MKREINDMDTFLGDSSGSIQREFDGAQPVKCNSFADALTKHFQSDYNNHCPMYIPRLSQSSEFLPFAPISNVDVCKVIKKLKPSKSINKYNNLKFTTMFALTHNKDF
jgi:hypothetical protein